MKINKFTVAALAGILSLSSCEKDLLEKVNPNQPSTQDFWKTQDDAVKAVTSAYGTLQLPGTYSRWYWFATDLRSDEGYSASPWTDLANFTRFLQLDYNFEPSEVMWTDHYRGVYRCNQIIANLPTITTIDAGLKTRLMAEAHFLRALYYFNLTSLYGNVPMILEVSTATSRAPQGTIESNYAQVLADLAIAEAGLPTDYTGADIGRATKGAAQALMGKTLMQQRKWAEASAQFTKVISSGKYRLADNYLDNFTMGTENNSESVFEVQFSDALQGDAQDAPGGSEGNNRAQFFGPRGIGWSDGQPRRWVFEEFTDKTTTGGVDPRRDITVFNSSMPIYGRTYAQRGYNDPNELFWRKYQNDRTRTFEDYHSGINIRVIRYADILLMQAEALNNLGQTAAAIPLINQVRTRSGIVPLTGSFSQAQMKTQILHERATELAGEGVRFFDLTRSGLLDNQAGVDQIKTRDQDFLNFVPGKSALLPLPRTDLDIDKNIKQNPGW
ncbi:membrane protein [Hymenobacter qilianensis]|uniref:Membrane protein n=1 Tax=Hymenobacter qilianensis TaxID=1385715 RepID=A0ACB5PQ69_9BACT|nr:RagB/SusD family nutrient uptake outer membrane protein [Hymenobacter qilianensis]GGF61029.1 membrane protein [Hymenobacter qilianensis]